MLRLVNLNLSGTHKELYEGRLEKLMQDSQMPVRKHIQKQVESSKCQRLTITNQTRILENIACESTTFKK